MTGNTDAINSLMDALKDLIAVIPEDVNDYPDSQAYRQVADRIKSANDTMKDIRDKNPEVRRRHWIINNKTDIIMCDIVSQRLCDLDEIIRESFKKLDGVTEDDLQALSDFMFCPDDWTLLNNADDRLKLSEHLFDLIEQYQALKLLADEAESQTNKWDGGMLIRESYWVEYCKQLMYESGKVPMDIEDYITVDWQETARVISNDYIQVDFGGVNYYMMA